MKDLSASNIEALNGNKASKKYLIFKLLQSRYAVPLSDVKEVIGLPQCISVPSAPSYFLGLINLRGKVISAIDLHQKLGSRPSEEKVKRPAAIILESAGITLGCVVDSVSEVLAIQDSLIEKSFEVDLKGQKDFIVGIAHFQDREMILILDLKKAADVSELIRQKSQI